MGNAEVHGYQKTTTNPYLLRKTDTKLELKNIDVGLNLAPLMAKF